MAGKVWGQPITRTGLQNVTECGDIRIVALHGFLDNAATWDLLMPFFLRYMAAAVPSMSVTVVALDWAGHGLSDHRNPQSDYSTWRYVEDLRYVFEELNWKRAIGLAHSMGSGALCQFAGTFPDLISHLILVDNFGPWSRPGKYAPMELIYHLRKSRALVTKAKPTYTTVEAATVARMKGQNPLSEKAAKPLVARGLMEVELGTDTFEDEEEEMEDSDSQPDRSRSAAPEKKLYTWRTDQRLTIGAAQHFSEDAAEAYMGRIKSPVLALLAKTGHWTKNARPMLDARIELLKNATGDLVVELVDSTHHLHLEEPELTAKLIVEFLKPRLAILDKPAPKRKQKGIVEQGVEAKL
ncbi:Alpha/Beta hydrolase protein [Hyaloraphidium curvatum]|nr:Alpha/Beta hydrolase protein [Hyaloraphidium curvatum]